MKSIFLISGVLIVGTVFLALSFGGYVFPRTWNYKITIAIETPEGVKSGSAVRQVRVRKELAGFIGANIINYKVIGEAAIIDLGRHGVLFDLPTYRVLLEAFTYRDNREIISYYERTLKVGMNRDLDIKKHSFIMFTDIDDPMSIRTVHSDDFEIIFGDGVSLKRISLEITNEDVTWGKVRKYLKWFDSKRMGLQKWDPEYPDPAKYFTKGSLVKGE